MNTINGSDILLSLGGKAVGGCTSHTTTFTTETKEIVTKPLPTAPKGSGLFANKRVTKKGVQVQFEGLRASDETQAGFKTMLKAWKESSTPIESEFFGRGQDANPYMKGNFIITNLVETAPAGEAATYSGTLENDGEPEIIDPTKIEGETLPSEGA